MTRRRRTDPRFSLEVGFEPRRGGRDALTDACRRLADAVAPGPLAAGGMHEKGGEGCGTTQRPRGGYGSWPRSGRSQSRFQRRSRWNTGGGAACARVSSDQQTERHTINSQVEALLARATADGHEIQAELRFLDDGQSGASLVRPALERLRDLAAMAAMAAIDVVYVHAPDRLARSYAHQAVLVEEFARAGAEIVFLNRPIGQTPEDTPLLQLQGLFAEYERARIIERSRRGKRHLAQAGAVSVLGRAPYGYRFVSRAAGDGVARFEVVENEAAAVRRIFQWIAQERASLAVVCQRLFEAGVPSPTGNARWQRSMIPVLPTNPA